MGHDIALAARPAARTAHIALNDLADAPAAAFRKIRFVLTDMDETLTRYGRLSARTYDALERLQRAGLKVIPVTAAPAGWCDQMARMWPVDGVIAENGGLFLARDNADRVVRTFWHSPEDHAAAATHLVELERAVRAVVPRAVVADDQPFRLTSLAFARSSDPQVNEAIAAALTAGGASVTSNDLWVLGWIGAYDKLAMSLRVLRRIYDIDHETAHSVVAYCGDSENDVPMFRHFEQTFGMSTVRGARLEHMPRWITRGPGGEGFIEAAQAIIDGRDR